MMPMSSRMFAVLGDNHNPFNSDEHIQNHIGIVLLTRQSGKFSGHTDVSNAPHLTRQIFVS
ncbi:transposase [Kluyvera ascorbata]